MSKIALIAAVAEKGAIGRDQQLLCHLPNDLKHFKTLTSGHTVVMGRKTFESFPKGALPNRRNIVLSKGDHNFPGAECFHSLEEALMHCCKGEDIYIIGGAGLYAEALAIADRLCLTEIEDDKKEADVFFPEIDTTHWKVVNRETHSVDEKHAYAYSFVDYESG